MKTPEEIKKGLECCNLNVFHCKECPYSLNATGIECDGQPGADALAYIKQLEEQISNLCCDFMDYVCDGVQNPAPYCAFASDMCVDGRGWCKRGSIYCNGFVPKVRDDRD